MDRNLVQALVERDVPPQVATLRVAKLHPEDVREVIGYFDSQHRAGSLTKPVGALKSMLADPAKWDFSCIAGRWKAPRAGVPGAKRKPTTREIADREVTDFIQGKLRIPELAALAARLGKPTHGQLRDAWMKAKGGG